MNTNFIVTNHNVLNNSFVEWKKNKEHNFVNAVDRSNEMQLVIVG